MNKRVLVTSTDLMMVQFLLPHIKYLREIGFEVNVACSNVGNRIDEVKNQLGKDTVFDISLKRSPLAFEKMIKGYIELKNLIKNGKYDLVWTNEPVMGIITRLAAKKAKTKETKILYMTHGYHFFKGCPLILKPFYFIEKQASKLCDAIVTISNEDYETTKNKFFCKSVYHINGIGLDRNKFVKYNNKNQKRKELNIPGDAYIIISVGELKPHKDHKTIIDALGILNNKNIFYVICGQGELKSYLVEKAKNNHIEDNVKFLGYRKDIPELLSCSDIFAFPSIREGLGLASLEAMSIGLPIIGSDTRGVRDYVINDYTGYLCEPENAKEFASAIEKLLNEQIRNKISTNCLEYVKKYDINNIKKNIYNIISNILE